MFCASSLNASPNPIPTINASPSITPASITRKLVCATATLTPIWSSTIKIVNTIIITFDTDPTRSAPLAFVSLTFLSTYFADINPNNANRTAAITLGTHVAICNKNVASGVNSTMLAAGGKNNTNTYHLVISPANLDSLKYPNTDTRLVFSTSHFSAFALSSTSCTNLPNNSPTRYPNKRTTIAPTIPGTMVTMLSHMLNNGSIMDAPNWLTNTIDITSLFAHCGLTSAVKSLC